LEQRWINSWTSSVLANDLKPLRIPLHSKKSKRCPTCRHILIKPEQKPQSVRFKIKISATSYLPLMSVSLPFLDNPTLVVKRSIRPGAMWEEDRSSASSNPVMNAGRTYPFVLSFTNPMYDPIHIRVNVLRSPLPTTTAATDEPGAVQQEKRRPPFAITLPTHTFSVAAFAEAWEYEDEDEDMVEGEHADPVDGRRQASASTSSGTTTTRGGKVKTVGVLERKTNTTRIGGEVVIGKEAQGDVKFLLMVTFTYRNDTVDDMDVGDGDGSPVGTTNPSISALTNANKQPEIRTFSYYVAIDLGKIAQRGGEGSMDVDERR